MRRSWRRPEAHLARWRRRPIEDVAQRFFGGRAQEGIDSREALIQDDAHREEIRALIDPVPQDPFGRDEARLAARVRVRRVTLRSGDAEVGHAARTVDAHEQVVRAHVVVNQADRLAVLTL